MNRTWTIIGVADVARSFKWYQTLLRARALVAGLEEEPHLNPSTGTEEFALHDPDGYYVMISALAAA